MKRLVLAALTAALMSTTALAQEIKSYSPYAGSEQPRNVYFGDTHLHTTYSPDAGLVTSNIPSFK